MNRADNRWMKYCFTLAEKGVGKVSPNPLVGAVIVKNGKMIAEGYHQRYGSSHAEVNAIRDAKRKKIDIKGATIYVNLEPCFHFGKTPPCVDEIVKLGFSRVVISTDDPNPLVAGKSIKKLRANGIKVKNGVLAKDGKKLNEKFFKYIRTSVPFVSVKVASTSDGFIARPDGDSHWISNAQSRMIVHQMRNEYDAVLVGATTVINDDPLLTVRTVEGRNPVRVVIDGNFSVPMTSKIFNDDANTIVYVAKRIIRTERKKIAFLHKKGIDIIPMPEHSGKLNIHHILRDLSARGIASVLVEGGQKTLTEFFNARAVDTFHVFKAKKKYGSGIKIFGDLSVSFYKRRVQSKHFGTDHYAEYSIRYV